MFRYLYEIFTKPRLQQTPVDELIMGVTVVVLILICGLLHVAFCAVKGAVKVWRGQTRS